ncbi:hypothetical protein [Arthrobacter sp. MA-N2]|uniref:hypothetical protein n=1 Tax=Arthrobacter sp. MA-N2 TaxID=1101188 RepID=UPI0004868F76|nr:hypothetical protein [Arthrobacter sp. MA-N2]
MNLTAIARTVVDDGTAKEIVPNLSLVRDEIAATTAKIDEQQVVTLARHIYLSGRIVVAQLESEGLDKFVASWKELLADVEGALASARKAS